MPFTILPGRNATLAKAWADFKAEQAKGERAAKKEAKASPELTAALGALLHPTVGVPKAPPALRSRPYRMLVASFPCINCGVEKHSQAAHAPPTGKGKKESDEDLFPLCTVSANDCHGKFDGMKLHASPAERRAQAKTWARQTQKRALKTGKVPKAVLERIQPPTKGSK
jgi:hypothetical protein